MFWGMLEMGVAMVAVCLPTLRALFQGWSPESIIRTFRSALSLGSSGSRDKPYRLSPAKRHEKGESETSLADTEAWGVPSRGARHEAYAMGQVQDARSENNKMPFGAVRIEKNFIQTVDSEEARDNIEIRNAH